MTKIKLETQELKGLNRARKALMTDPNPTFTGQSRNNKFIADLGIKYGVSNEVIIGLSTWNK